MLVDATPALDELSVDVVGTIELECKAVKCGKVWCWRKGMG